MKFASAYSTCDDETLLAASERAVGFIEYNHIVPQNRKKRTKVAPLVARRTTGGHTRRRCPTAKDTKQIFADYGQQVTARCREHQGPKKLLSKAPLDCDELQ